MSTTKPIAGLACPWPEPDEKLQTELISKHGELHRIEHDGFFIFIRPALRAEFRRWQAQSSDPKNRGLALETLAKAGCVYPEVKQLDELLERRPALGTTFGNACLEVAGLGDAEKKTL